MLGIFCFALPVAIIGPGFYEEIRRRDFVVTFAMVAHVPLFARLDAASISDLVSILTARTVHTGTVIIRKGGARRHVLHCQWRRRGRGARRQAAPSRRGNSSEKWRFSRTSAVRRP